MLAEIKLFACKIFYKETRCTFLLRDEQRVLFIIGALVSSLQMECWSLKNYFITFLVVPSLKRTMLRPLVGEVRRLPLVS